jgi:hypothetical protein
MLFLASINTLNNSTFADGIRNSFPSIFTNSFFSFGGNDNTYTKETKFFASDYPKVENVSLNMTIDKGELKMQDSDSDNMILSIKASFPNATDEYTINNTVNNQTDMVINFDTKNEENSFGFFGNSGPLYNFNLSKGKQIQDLNFKLGAGKSTMDFNNIVINKILADVGAGEMILKLTDNSIPANMDLKVGAGEMNISIPKSTGYKISYKVGIGEVSVNGTNKGNGMGSNGTLISDNFFNAIFKTEITLNVGIGAFKLNYK